MWARPSSVRARFSAVAVIFATVTLVCCDSESPQAYVDLPRVSELLRVGDGSPPFLCDQGFPGFLRSAAERLAEEEGTDRYREAIDSFLRPGEGGLLLDAEDQLEPALLRLLLHRYAVGCRSSAVDELEAQLEELLNAENEQNLDLQRRLRELLEERQITGARLRSAASREEEGRVILVDLPLPERGGDSAATAELFVLLTCLRCRVGSTVSGPRQIGAALAALEALAASRIELAHPIRLVICLDASRKPARCRPEMDLRGEQVTAAIALDGTEPLVVAWSAEVSWHLALPHAEVTESWLELARRRPRRGNAETLFVVDAAASASLDELPERAWMELVDLERSPQELERWVDGRLESLAEAREGSRYEVEVRDDRVRVTALAQAMPAWEISERQSALWDLSAASRLLRAADPPRAHLAAMLRVIHRFDGDPYGARLGLHYEDPIGGPVLVAPCSLIARDGRVILGLRIYRPPGLPRISFVARMDEARERLRYAAGRPVIEAERQVGDPSRVEPDSPEVQLVQRAIAEVSTFDANAPLPEVSGSPRPGLGILLPDALSIRLPTETARVNPRPPISLVTELLWQFAVVPNDELREASDWE